MHGDRYAPVLIDQEGGRVQRIREPICRATPPGQILAISIRDQIAKGLRAAWLMSRLHAFDLLKLSIDVDCLPVLDVPIEGAAMSSAARAYGKEPCYRHRNGPRRLRGPQGWRRPARGEAHARPWPRHGGFASRAARGQCLAETNSKAHDFAALQGAEGRVDGRWAPMSSIPAHRSDGSRPPSRKVIEEIIEAISASTAC